MSAVPSEVVFNAALGVRTGGKLSALEALRGFAALYVFFHHLRVAPNGGWGSLFYFGQEAVILFFLLSGFVIYYSTWHRNLTIWEYFKLRFRRIFPILALSLLLAYAAACAEAGTLVSPKWGTLIGNLFMLQDVSSLKPGVIVDTYYGNSPLWSLSYEWWFYMAFIPLGLRGRPTKSTLHAVFATSLSGAALYGIAPNQPSLFAGYLLLWWAGVELAREYVETGEVTFSRQSRLLAMLLILAAVWLAPLLLQRPEKLSLGISPILHVRHFLAAVAFIAVAIAWGRWGYAGFGALLGSFAIVAPVSYFLYATHQPILQLVHASGLFPVGWIAGLSALVIVLALGWLVEVRLQARVNRLIR